MMFYNPSRTARLWDPDNNRTIEPGEKTSVRPAKQLLATGRMIEIHSQAEMAKAIMPKGPVTITSASIEADPAQPEEPAQPSTSSDDAVAAAIRRYKAKKQS